MTRQDAFVEFVEEDNNANVNALANIITQRGGDEEDNNEEDEANKEEVNEEDDNIHPHNIPT